MTRYYPIFLLAIAAATHAFASVTVTSRAANSTVTSPVHYVATAKTSTCLKGVASMGIYINNKLVYTVKGTSLNHSLTLATGAEHTVVEEWDYCGGASYTTINLTVKSASPAPTISIGSNPQSITKGASSTLTVKASNATQVTVSGSDGSQYTLPSGGGTQTVSPTTTTTYTAKATGAGGTASAMTSVTVSQITSPTATIAASPATITKGNSSALTVTASNATQVTVRGSDGSMYTLSPSGGTQVVSPTTTTT